MDYLGRSMKAQMKDANRENANFTLIVGENELNDGLFILRNMRETDEEALTFTQILSKLQKERDKEEPFQLYNLLNLTTAATSTRPTYAFNRSVFPSASYHADIIHL